jgi:hypothetical protein
VRCEPFPQFSPAGPPSHPADTVPATLYSGHVYIWSYETQQIVKTFELTDVPVRAGRFIARKNWIICGSDDLYVNPSDPASLGTDMRLTS